METEIDLSLKQQFLDVVLIRKGAEPIPRRLPDDFEDLAAHNLVTFKSHQETLDSWALCDLLHLFSAREELLRYGREHFRPQSPETSSLLYELFSAYSEDVNMSDKLKEFVRQSIDKLLQSLPPEERLKGLPAEERLKGLPAEERLKGISAEEVVRALPPEVLETIARRLKANGSEPKSP